ncbi:hypothetical protein BaRGS_00004852 [Batillaria attramentaria]|uniref:Uncharacterized protein n=1 Tax=Batillaria attramentaria TaxID=370345 RepID=A0ABD0LVX4_9CAEN
MRFRNAVVQSVIASSFEFYFKEAHRSADSDLQHCFLRTQAADKLCSSSTDSTSQIITVLLVVRLALIKGAVYFAAPDLCIACTKITGAREKMEHVWNYGSHLVAAVLPATGSEISSEERVEPNTPSV